VLHEVGLRNTLEPDPDNTGVGSFPNRTAFYLDSQREFSCFMDLEARGVYAKFRCSRCGSRPVDLIFTKDSWLAFSPERCIVFFQSELCAFGNCNFVLLHGFAHGCNLSKAPAQA